MLSPKYFIYMATGPDILPWVSMSSNPKVDARRLEKKGYRRIWIFHPPQTVGTAEKVLTELQRRKYGMTPRQFHTAIKHLIHPDHPWHSGAIQMESLANLETAEEIPEGLEELFGGRSFLNSEIPGILRDGGYEVPWDPEDWMQDLYFQSKIKRLAAVGLNRFGLPECRRCGATTRIVVEDCLFCGSRTCLTCTNCQSMGLSKSCIPLYLKPGSPELPANEHIQPQLDFSLTPAQEKASEALRDFGSSGRKTALVWAVCGGGKTEVAYGITAQVLNGGGRVLFAIPRKDVVVELLPRLIKAFPSVAKSAWYGGSYRENAATTRLFVATTHQCLRFYQNFDLVILDEADAFPYQGSAMLHYAVERSLKPTGILVIMTATPDQRLLREVKSGRMTCVTIPARYHRKPLIVPEICKVKFPDSPVRTQEIPQTVQDRLLAAHAAKRRVIIFLPTIRLIETVGRAIVAWGYVQGLNGEVTHAQKRNQNQVKEGLKEGKYDFLVASTVFERGITIADLDVFVLYADYELIYDCRTLVQISGRTGRLGDFACVIFYAQTVTRAMKEAIRWIEQMNEQGLQAGFLDKTR